MLMYVYLGILAVLSVLIIRNMYRNNSIIHYFEAALVLIPFLLRLLRVK